MKSVMPFIKTKLALLGAVVVATVIGDATTAVVMASIPDSNGQIHACYTTGLLAKVRIIDSATQNCNGTETAINWSQNGGGPIAYAHILYDASTSTFSLDSSRSSGVSNFYASSDTSLPLMACFHVSPTPKSALATLSTQLGGNTSIRTDLKDANGWTNTNTDNGIGVFCAANDPSANVGVETSSPTFSNSTSSISFVQVF
jgi:hypothetical protein